MQGCHGGLLQYAACCNALSAGQEQLVQHYFEAGYTYAEICSILALRHAIPCSIRTVGRILQRLHLHRNCPDDDTLNSVLQCLEMELTGSGLNLGCRSMRRRMLTRYGLNVPRDVVLEGLRMLDPEGIEGRQRHRLRRRVYTNEGPNFAIHVDQYDKLKPYGFAIHGGIDGFSRRLLWLRVSSTNQDPDIVASYFMNYVKEIQAVPRCIQMDRGTENTRIEQIETAFQAEYFPEQQAPCVIHSASPHNQRIECFWRTLRDMMSNFWMDNFRELVDNGVLDCTSHLHLECLRFCLTPLIKSELDEVRIEWNQHRIRRVNNIDAHAGKPDLMYFVPYIFGAQEFCRPVPSIDIESVTQEFTSQPPRNGCSPDFEDICQDLLHVHGKRMPSSCEEGLELFRWLLTKLA